MDRALESVPIRQVYLVTLALGNGEGYSIQTTHRKQHVSSTGHKNVYKNSKDCGKPYYVARKINKKSVWFGAFATIEDAISYTMTLPSRTKKTNKDRHQPKNPVNGRFIPRI